MRHTQTQNTLPLFILLSLNSQSSHHPSPIHSAPMTSTLHDSTIVLKKKKRRPAGTPDPDAEVVSLSPRTLLESDRYVCEICNQGFQRDQNLQMHRRRHKVPWKRLKREPSAAAVGPGGAGGEAIKKRVFVCPEPSCLHHDPSHALGDLVGIKKHYRRKHSDSKQWVCDRCSKGYAVQSDYKAHLKTCGTRGHSCDCGKVFSRVESFIEHQDTCNANRSRLDTQIPQTLSLSRTASSPSPSTDTNFSSAATTTWSSFLRPNLELQLLPTLISKPAAAAAAATNTTTSSSDEAYIAHLNLSLGPSSGEKAAAAEEARRQAKRQLELAEQEFAHAKRIRQQAQAELDRALLLREHAAKSIDSMLLEITCQSCKLKMWPQSVKPAAAYENSLAATSVVTDGELK